VIAGIDAAAAWPEVDIFMQARRTKLGKSTRTAAACSVSRERARRWAELRLAALLGGRQLDWPAALPS